MSNSQRRVLGLHPSRLACRRSRQCAPRDLRMGSEVPLAGKGFHVLDACIFKMGNVGVIFHTRPGRKRRAQGDELLQRPST